MIRVMLNEPWSYENKVVVLRRAVDWFFSPSPDLVSFIDDRQLVVAVFTVDSIMGFEVIEDE